jgi:hypothetical protein
MLRESLSSFLSEVPASDKNAVLRAVSHFALRLDYKAYRNNIEFLRDINENLHQVFYKEVREFIKSSFECRKVWRAICYSIRHSKKLPESAAKFSADLEDARFIWNNLRAEDKTEVREFALTEEDYGFLEPHEFADLVNKIDKYAGKTAYLKLRFLSDNDKSFDLEDFKTELLSHGIQVIRLYEHKRDLLMLENYAKAAISRQAVNLIQLHTSESRARVRNSTKACGTCIFCLTDKSQKCCHAVAEFQQTTVNIDLPVFTPVIDSNSEKAVNEQNFVAFLKAGLSPEAGRLINLLVDGAADEAFESWLDEEHGQTVDALMSQPRKLMRLYCAYLDLHHKDVNDQIRKRYASYRQSLHG